MAAYKYIFKPTAYINADPQAAVELCERLENTVGLTAETLLDASRDEKAVLHKCFEWDDSKAAEEYRKHQARHIINSLVVVNEDDKEKSQPVRVFCHVVTNDGQREYRSVANVIKKEDMLNQVIQQAISDLQAFNVKYNQLRNVERLKEIFESIDKLGKEYKNGE